MTSLTIVIDYLYGKRLETSFTGHIHILYTSFWTKFQGCAIGIGFSAGTNLDQVLLKLEQVSKNEMTKKSSGILSFMKVHCRKLLGQSSQVVCYQDFLNVSFSLRRMQEKIANNNFVRDLFLQRVSTVIETWKKLKREDSISVPIGWKMLHCTGVWISKKCGSLYINQVAIS